MFFKDFKIEAESAIIPRTAVITFTWQKKICQLLEDRVVRRQPEVRIVSNPVFCVPFGLGSGYLLVFCAPFGLGSGY
jgi:hypothetical protein